jgi:hypothetical protein
MATAREIDENGYLTVRGNPISSFGVFDYSAGQLGLEGDPMRIVKVFRPESAVNNQATMDSFKNVPLIIKHAMLSGFEDDDEDGVVAPEAKGIDGVLTGNVYYEAPWMRGDIKVFSRKAQKALKLGLKDLSLGYDCRFYYKPGTFEGQDYEYVQDNLIGNHIAMVPEGRVSGAAVLDAKIIGSKAFVFDGEGENSGYVRMTVEEVIFNTNEENMATKAKTAAQPVRRKAMDNAVQQLLGLIPALKTFLEQEATEPAHQEGGAGEGQAEQAGVAGNAGEQGNSAAAAQATGENEGGDAGFGAEGGESAGAEPDLNSLITEVEACLAKLKAAAGGGAAQDDMNEGQSGQEATATAEDSVEGLQEESHNATVPTGDEANGSTPVDDNNGKASAGPAGGINAKAGDSSLRAFYADSAAKTRIYDGLSEVVGAFNCAAMDAREVAAYGVKKLGLKNVPAGSEINAVELYLQGRAAAAANIAKDVQRTSVGDSKVGYNAPQRGTGDASLDTYIKACS